MSHPQRRPDGQRVSEAYEVRRIRGGVGKEFIREHHYTHGCHNGPMTWGLFEGEALIGVIAFATPSSENVCASVFGVEHKRRVTELHRLVILDGTPTNTESYFIAYALRELKKEKPNLWAVLSFADGTEGHRGTIYQATNALYLGMTGKARFWRAPDGRLRHPRQNGHNVTPEEAKEFGWKAERREAKFRYLFLLPDSKRHRRWMTEQVSNRIQTYPQEKIS